MPSGHFPSSVFIADSPELTGLQPWRQTCSVLPGCQSPPPGQRAVLPEAPLQGTLGKAQGVSLGYVLPPDVLVSHCNLCLRLHVAVPSACLSAVWLLLLLGLHLP